MLDVIWECQQILDKLQRGSYLLNLLQSVATTGSIYVACQSVVRQQRNGLNDHVISLNQKEKTPQLYEDYILQIQIPRIYRSSLERQTKV